MKKQLAASITAMVLLGNLFGCQSAPDKISASVPAAPAPVSTASQEKSGEKPLIGVLVFDYANNYCTYIRNAIKYYVTDDVESVMQDSQNDQAKQSEQVDTLLQKGVAALCVNLVEPTAASTIIEKVRPHDIPLIFFNKCPSDEDMLSYEKAYYSGCSPYDGGIMQAEMALDAVKLNPKADKNGDGKIQYVILKGEPGHPDAELCTQANEDFFAKQTDIKFEKLDIQSANWNTAEAKDVMDAWIGRYGDKIELVMTNNDGMMLGGVEALKGAGYLTGDVLEKQVVVIGHDAIPEALPLIADGTLYGCILQDAVNEGRATIVMAENMIAGRPADTDLGVEIGKIKDFRSPFIKIVKENIKVAEEIYEKALGK